MSYRRTRNIRPVGMPAYIRTGAVSLEGRPDPAISIISLCPRCEEEVAQGAPWCPHCGRDMTVYSPVETVRRVELERLQPGRFDPRLAWIGIVAAAVVAAVEAVLLSIRPLAALCVGSAVMLVILFVLVEIILPEGAPAYGGHGGGSTQTAGARSSALGALAVVLPSLAVLIGLLTLHS